LPKVRRCIVGWDSWSGAGTDRVIAAVSTAMDGSSMKKRVVATVLWFYAGWAFGAMIAFVTGLSAVLAPVLAVASAGMVGFDPRHLFWTPRVQSAAAATVSVKAIHNPA
jgi:hypothetical protein